MLILNAVVSDQVDLKGRGRMLRIVKNASNQIFMLACSQNHDQVVETILPAHYLNHNQSPDI